MRFKLRCKGCAATCWVDGWEEPDVNAAGINEDKKLEWEEYDPVGALCHGLDCTCGHIDCPALFMKFPDCQHEDYEIIDRDDADSSEYPEPPWNQSSGYE